MRGRLFLHILSLEARTAMSYRVAFWANAAVSVVVGITIPYFLWSSIYEHVYETTGRVRIGGYTLEAMLLYYVAAALLSKVVRGPDMALGISDEIYEGKLSRFLIYPAPYLRFKYAQHLGAILPFVVQMVVFVAIATPLLELPQDFQVSAGSIARAAIFVLAANLLYFLISWPLQAIAFWADNVWSIAVLLRLASGFLGGGMLPLSLFPAWAQKLLLLTPFPYLFYVPVNTFLGKSTPADWLHGLFVLGIWAVLLLGLGTAVWKRGELRYTGVGI